MKDKNDLGKTACRDSSLECYNLCHVLFAISEGLEFTVSRVCFNLDRFGFILQLGSFI